MQGGKRLGKGTVQGRTEHSVSQCGQGWGHRKDGALYGLGTLDRTGHIFKNEGLLKYILVIVGTIFVSLFKFGGGLHQITFDIS